MIEIAFICKEIATTNNGNCVRNWKDSRQRTKAYKVRITRTFYLILNRLYIGHKKKETTVDNLAPGAYAFIAHTPGAIAFGKHGPR